MEEYFSFDRKDMGHGPYGGLLSFSVPLIRSMSSTELPGFFLTALAKSYMIYHITYSMKRLNDVMTEDIRIRVYIFMAIRYLKNFYLIPLNRQVSSVVRPHSFNLSS